MYENVIFDLVYLSILLTIVIFLELPYSQEDLPDRTYLPLQNIRGEETTALNDLPSLFLLLILI